MFSRSYRASLYAGDGAADKIGLPDIVAVVARRREGLEGRGTIDRDRVRQRPKQRYVGGGIAVCDAIRGREPILLDQAPGNLNLRLRAQDGLRIGKLAAENLGTVSRRNAPVQKLRDEEQGR